MVLIKNITLVVIEIEDIGISIDAGEIYDISDDDPASPGLAFHIAAGNIVYMDPDNPTVELTQTESNLFFDAFSTTNFYRKDEIDALLVPLAASADVYLKAETYNATEVDVIFDGIVNNAPVLLDTLSELSAALGNDANFATTITTQIAGKANIVHNHNTDYYLKPAVDALLLLKSDTTHNHDTTYAPFAHDHDAVYAPIAHNHDATYATLAHNHDATYAPIGHNHDLIYAIIAHNHNNIYYTKSQVDNLIASNSGPENYTYFVSKSVLTVDDTDFTEKLNENVTIVSGKDGRYRIGWSYQWNYNSTSQDFRARVVVNNVVIWEHRQEPKDSSGSFGSTGTNQRLTASGFDFVFLPVGTTHIHIELATSSSGRSASMWNTVLELWKI